MPSPRSVLLLRKTAELFLDDLLEDLHDQVMRCQTLVNDYFRITFRGTCNPMLLLRIQIRLLMNGLLTSMGILVRLRPVLTPEMLAEWAREFHTIWIQAEHWATGFHLGTVQPSVWHAPAPPGIARPPRWISAVLSVTEENARETFRQHMFPAELFTSLSSWTPFFNQAAPIWDALRTMGENLDSFLWAI